MSKVKAYYDGSSFVPIEPVRVPKGVIVDLMILLEETVILKAAERLAAFKKLTNEIHELNKIEPFPSVYDDILGNRVNFTRELDL